MKPLLQLSFVNETILKNKTTLKTIKGNDLFTSKFILGC